jgi:hypothetical protein
MAVLAAVAACSPPPGAIKEDLATYLERSQTWAPLEAETAKTIERVLRTEFVDAAEVQRQIADSRPRLLAHLDRVRAYTPRLAPIKRIHARYISAWQLLLGGYDAIEEGFSSQDYTKLARGREAMARWRKTLEDVATDLRELQERIAPAGAGAVES